MVLGFWPVWNYTLNKTSQEVPNAVKQQFNIPVRGKMADFSRASFGVAIKSGPWFLFIGSTAWVITWSSGKTRHRVSVTVENPAVCFVRKIGEHL